MEYDGDDSGRLEMVMSGRSWCPSDDEVMVVRRLSQVVVKVW